MKYAPEEKLKRIREVKKDLRALAETCRLCPHGCGVDRQAGERGLCQAPAAARVASACVHRGEEPPISGTRGSGTIFFSHCSVRCVFCQNFQISHEGRGKNLSRDELAGEFLALQRRGVHNINLVSPTPYLPWILDALETAYEGGLTLPLVYNTHGYESADVIALLAGIVDVYLPDLKYSREDPALRYSAVRDYPETARRAIMAMYDQVGLLRPDDEGMAEGGMIVRHLVLPGQVENSKEALDFLAALDNRLTVAIMSQYHPMHRAGEFPPLDRRLTAEEYDAVVEHALDLGLDNSLIQELDSSEHYLPDFEQLHPFEHDEAVHGTSTIHPLA